MMEIRGQDEWGAGWFGAPRGDRTHNGIDICCKKGDPIHSFTMGEVTKIGYPYPPKDTKKGHLRYVEITFDGNRFRYFYVHSIFAVGAIISPGERIGFAQGLDDIYPGITDHYHFEAIDPEGNYVDPTEMVL